MQPGCPATGQLMMAIQNGQRGAAKKAKASPHKPGCQAEGWPPWPLAMPWLQSAHLQGPAVHQQGPEAPGPPTQRPSFDLQCEVALVIPSQQQGTRLRPGVPPSGGPCRALGC